MSRGPCWCLVIDGALAQLSFEKKNPVQALHMIDFCRCHEDLIPYLTSSTAQTKQFCETSLKKGNLSEELSISYQCILGCSRPGVFCTFCASCYNAAHVLNIMTMTIEHARFAFAFAHSYLHDNVLFRFVSFHVYLPCIFETH